MKPLEQVITDVDGHTRRREVFIDKGDDILDLSTDEDDAADEDDEVMEIGDEYSDDEDDDASDDDDDNDDDDDDDDQEEENEIVLNFKAQKETKRTEKVTKNQNHSTDKVGEGSELRESARKEIGNVDTETQLVKAKRKLGGDLSNGKVNKMRRKTLKRESTSSEFDAQELSSSRMNGGKRKKMKRTLTEGTKEDTSGNRFTTNLANELSEESAECEVEMETVDSEHDIDSAEEGNVDGNHSYIGLENEEEGDREEGTVQCNVRVSFLFTYVTLKLGVLTGAFRFLINLNPTSDLCLFLFFLSFWSCCFPFTRGDK